MPNKLATALRWLADWIENPAVPAPSVFRIRTIEPKRHYRYELTAGPEGITIHLPYEPGSPGGTRELVQGETYHIEVKAQEHTRHG